MYANIHARSSVRVTIAEGYTLAMSLRETAGALCDAASAIGGDIDDATVFDLLLTADRMHERADAIERTLEADKRAQIGR
jgi:hypothetical protein